MNWQVVSSNPFFTVALPMVITFIVATWTSIHRQNKRVEDLRDTMKMGFGAIEKRLDGIDHRLERIEAKLDSHGERIAKLEGPSLVRVQ